MRGLSNIVLIVCFFYNDAKIHVLTRRSDEQNQNTVRGSEA